MKVRELIGKITLQENVSPIERNKVNGTFVIHIPNPLASYYSRFTEVNRPNSIVLVTKDPVSFEKILRATGAINKQLDLHLNGAKCEVLIGRTKYSGVRFSPAIISTTTVSISRPFSAINIRTRRALGEAGKS